MRFKYLSDPLFLFCLLLYFVNRFALKRLIGGAFLEGHLNDVLCIPFWVPIMLWGMRRIGLRREDGPPRSYEVIVPLLLWSAVFELWLPRMPLFRGLAFADPLDILAFTVGALVAAVFWKIWYRERRSSIAADVNSLDLPRPPP